MKKYRISFYIFSSLSIILTGYIVISSCLKGSDSSSQSGRVVDFFKMIINGIFPNTINEDNIGWFTNFIRKGIGHYGAFLVDGVFISLTVYFYCLLKEKKFYLPQLYIVLPIGLFLAVLTESIQLIVPNRSGEALDMLIDFGGYITGFVVLILIYYLIDRKQRVQKA